MINALTRIGDALTLVWETKREDADGRVFFSICSHFSSYDTQNSRLNARPDGSHLSAHKRMEIEMLPTEFDDALKEMADTLETIPVLAQNKIRPALNLELVGHDTKTPLAMAGAVQGMGGLTPYACEPFLAQSVWLTPMGRNSYSFDDWCQNEADRWATAATIRCDETSPYWYMHTDPRQNRKCPALKAHDEEGAIALYDLLFPYRNPSIVITPFQRETPPTVSSLRPWT